MLKKKIAMVLCLALMLSVLPLEVFGETGTAPEVTQPAEASGETGQSPAQPEEEKKLEVTATPVGAWGKSTSPQQLRTKDAKIQLLRKAIIWDFQNALVQEGKESLFGFCGLQASYQLFYRGINDWRKSADGKNYYDEYAAMNMTSGGYVPQAYSAEEYTLEQALNKVTNYGSHEVYNVLVCFEKTNTKAGAVFGHVVFVYGIIDGVVYFTEGGSGFGKEAGEPMECTIAQFAASYNTWTEFEGIVVLGCKEYLDNCAAYQSELFASCIAPAQLTALPCQEETQLLRTVQKGERLYVIGLYENREHQYYYQIDNGGEIGYVPAETLMPILYLHDTFTLDEPKLPQTLKPGKDFSVDGTVVAPGALLSQVCVQILDQDGNCIQKVTREAEGEKFDLGSYQINSQLNFGKLEPGSYTVLIQADSTVCAWTSTAVVNQTQTQTLAQQLFTVGEEEAAAQPPVQAAASPCVAEETQKNGWYYENGTWYCYKQGTPCTGWVYAAGVAYYLKEDGSVTTGWATVEGKSRLFTATGALHTGWLKEQDGTKYMDEYGHSVTGWQRIDGTYHYFDDNGFWTDHYSGAALRQLRSMGLSVKEIKAANAEHNHNPQE